MRKVLISLLLAGAVAMPAIAAPRDWSNNQQSHEDSQSPREQRQQVREERQQARSEGRGERPQMRIERAGPPDGQAPAIARVDRVNVPQQAFSGGGDGAGRFDGGDRFARFEARPDRGNFSQQAERNVDNRVAPGPRIVTPRSVRAQDRGQFRQERIDARELRQSNRPLPNVMRSRDPLIVSNVPRPGTQPPLRADNHVSRPQWSTNWRHDGRYDWRNYRNRHRSFFHLGFYFDPYGWGYQPFSIGWRLWPNYYSSNYWINDPWMYRLPYAPPGYRWIRYWNDALLVDTWTGEVVDVIPGFFW